MINYLLLLSGNDIPFIQAKLAIHQPTIKEIAYIGEEEFFTGCQYLNFSKENLSAEDKNLLVNLSDFEVLMTLLKNESVLVKKYKLCMLSVLQLLFPDYEIKILPSGILITKKDQEGKLEIHSIDNNNFQQFKHILAQMFYLFKMSNNNKYNPGGPQARALVQKFRQRQQKLARMRNQNKGQQKIETLSRYISILTVGEKKDMNTFFQYTVYQLFDEFNRFRLKQDFDIYVKCKLAGARDMEETKNWMDNLYSQDVY